MGTTSAAKTVKLSDNGHATLNIASITTNGDFAQTNNCGSSLAAGGTCSISVTFMPSVGGALTGTLAIDDNAAGGSQTVSLSGSGTKAVTVSPTSLAFGTVSPGVTSVQQTVTVSNHQSVAISLAASIGGTNPGDFAISGTGTNCGATLAATGNCAYAITFTPAAGKSYSAKLNISDSPDPGSPHSVALTGKGS